MQRPFDEFAVFAEEEGGPIWRADAPGLEEAKRLAQQRADQEGIEFFVFSFRTASEVARFRPHPKRGRREGPK